MYTSISELQANVILRVSEIYENLKTSNILYVYMTLKGSGEDLFENFRYTSVSKPQVCKSRNILYVIFRTTSCINLYSLVIKKNYFFFIILVKKQTLCYSVLLVAVAAARRCVKGVAGGV